MANEFFDNYQTLSGFVNVNGENEIDYTVCCDVRRKHLSSIAIDFLIGWGELDIERHVCFEFDSNGAIVESRIGMDIPKVEYAKEFISWLFENVIDPIQISINDGDRTKIMNLEEV